MEAHFKIRDTKEGVPERSTKGGKLAESLVNYGIDHVGFLGEDARTIVASRFDDIYGGIDSFVEFESEGMTSHIALGIDVTRNPDDLAKKFDKIRESIDKGELSSGKYFKSQNFRGELRHVLRIVVGADQPTIDSISDLIVRSIRLRKSIKNEQPQSASADQLKKEFQKNSAALERHPLQWILLLEIKHQLKAAQKRGGEKGQLSVVAECEKVLSIINGVIKDKQNEGQSIDEEILLNDRVYQLIQQEVKLY
jgi:hypothetical protein